MPGPRSKRRPDAKQPSSVDDEGDLETEEAVDTSQTDEDKRRVRRTLRDLHDKLLQCKDGNGEDFSYILQEANQILKDVKGTQEAMEDAKMFRMLCQKVREMSEDTNTNEKKFHVDEFAANIGRFINANTERGNHVKITRPQLVSLGKRVAGKFRRTPSFNFILGAVDTEAPEEKESRRNARRPAAAERQKAVTKTAIVERSQADGQMTDKLVASTREILNKEYRSNGKKPVNYFEFVIDPESFGNTVENMFHVSFLVKQRVVQLSVDDNIGLPVLEPASSRAREAGEEGGGGKNQAIISLSYEDWEEFVEALSIKKPAIVHDEELRRAIRAKT